LRGLDRGHGTDGRVRRATRDGPFQPELAPDDGLITPRGWQGCRREVLAAASEAEIGRAVIEVLSQPSLRDAD